MSAPKRADARTNRERILTAAREALARSTRPTGASLTAIAKQAGVGIGTLYRHFPTREALIMAIYQHELQGLIDLAPKLLDEHPPHVALRRWFDQVAHYGRLKFGAAEVIHAATNGGLDDEEYEPLVRAVGVLLDAAATEGTVKRGLDPEDVLLQLSVLWRINPDNGGTERSARILDLIVDGLRTTG